MHDWKNSLIPADATIRDAIKTINDGGFEIAIVADGEEKLLGTVTDGDIRRGLLDGLDMSAPAKKIMNRDPLVAPPDTSHKGLLKIMNSDLFRQIPLLDDTRRVVGVAHIRDLTKPIESRRNWVVLMAGGLGERLMPLTKQTPKPLLTIGDKPLLETILESFVEQDFSRFYISVNYKAETIKAHFGDGEKWGVDIRYLEEDRRLGTVGALRLVPEKPDAPMIVMNGDLITRINFQDLLDYHELQNSHATMCVRQYDFQVPFGVVGINGNRIASIDEKPVHRFFVNAGIYVLNPALIDRIPADANHDMTDLFEGIIADGEKTTVFPVHEYWLDVGRIDDLDKAKRDFENGFNP